MGCQETEREKKNKRERAKMRELLELPYNKIVKSGTIRLAFYNFCVRSSFNSFYVGLKLFSFSVHLLASPPALGMPINRKRKQGRENEADKEIIT